MSTLLEEYSYVNMSEFCSKRYAGLWRIRRRLPEKVPISVLASRISTKSFRKDCKIVDELRRRLFSNGTLEKSSTLDSGESDGPTI